MERKALVTYGVIIVLGLGIMVGVVLFLRARNAPPQEPALGGPGTAVQGGTGLQGVRPFKPIDQAPTSPPYQTGQPVPAVTPPNGGAPYGGGLLTH